MPNMALANKEKNETIDSLQSLLNTPGGDTVWETTVRYGLRRMSTDSLKALLDLVKNLHARSYNEGAKEEIGESV